MKMDDKIATMLLNDDELASVSGGVCEFKIKEAVEHYCPFCMMDQKVGYGEKAHVVKLNKSLPIYYCYFNKKWFFFDKKTGSYYRGPQGAPF